MIVIDGFWWFVFAVVICGWHAGFIINWRRELRLRDAWWRKYDAESQQRHAALMQAFARENDDDDDDDDDDNDDDDDDDEEGEGDEGEEDDEGEDEEDDEEVIQEEVDVAALELDPATQKIVDDFGAQAQKRASELLPRSPDNMPLERIRDMAFCLGYKAGVIDLGAEHRQVSGAEIWQLVAVFAAACAWRDAKLADESALEKRLIDAVDAVRAAKKAASP